MAGGNGHDGAHVGAAPRAPAPHPHRPRARSWPHVIAFALQIVFLASFLPAGTGERVDRGPRRALVVAARRGDAPRLVCSPRSARCWGRARDARPQHRVRVRDRLRVGRGSRGRHPGAQTGLGPIPLGREHDDRSHVGATRNVSFRRGPVVALVTVTFYVSVIIAARHVRVPAPRRCERVVIKTLKNMLGL